MPQICNMLRESILPHSGASRARHPLPHFCATLHRNRAHTETQKHRDEVLLRASVSLCEPKNKEAPRQFAAGLHLFSALDRIRTCGLRLRRATLYPAELRARIDGEANKPSSVPGEPGEDHFSGTDVAAGLVQPTRDCEEPESFAGRATPRHCLALLRVGLAVPRLLPAARCALTAPFHPCLCPRRGPSAVCFLLRFPSPRDARALPGTLPCGARTFLDARGRRGPHSPPAPVLSKLNAQERTRTSTPVKAPDP